MAEGVRRVLPEARIEVVPLADGGPGTIDTITAVKKVETFYTAVQDPIGRSVEAKWCQMEDETGLIEAAEAIGLWRLKPGERDPRIASSYGLGQLIGSAIEAGCRRLIVAIGGSATNDGGAGMAQALGVRFLNSSGKELAQGGAHLSRLDRIDSSGLDERLRAREIVAATDVMNPLCGPSGASLVYGPQKGASAEVALELDTALRRFAALLERDLGVAVLDVPGAGAAGGLGAGLAAFLGAKLRPGFDVIAEIIGLRALLHGADLVLTGEGRLDGQTSYGKTVFGLARLASAENVRVVAVPACLGPGWEKLSPFVDGVEPVADSRYHARGGVGATTENADLND